MFKQEDDAAKCVEDLNNRWFNGAPIYAELSPVTDFRFPFLVSLSKICVCVYISAKRNFGYNIGIVGYFLKTLLINAPRI